MELMGEEEPSKWRLLFLLLSPGPGGRGSPPCSLPCKHLFCLPRAARRRPCCTPLPCTPGGPCCPPLASGTSQPPQDTKHCCGRLLKLSLLLVPFSHRSGPRALACTRKHTHSARQLLALKAIAVQAGNPRPCYSSSSLSPLHKAGERKELTAAREINHVSI